jgi:hypothetical protein
VEVTFVEIEERKYSQGKNSNIIEYDVGKRKRRNILVKIVSGKKHKERNIVKNATRKAEKKNG